MKIGDIKVRHQQKAVELRSEAQELKDAAGGEKASALQAKGQATVHNDAYVKANAASRELSNEAAQLRSEAAAKLKEAVGGRGLHALENVARGFGKLMAKLTGQRLETTVSLKQDPDAKAAADKLLALADVKDAAAAAQRDVALKAHAQATAALAKMEGHERTAANHMALAGKLLGEAKGHDRTASFAGAAQQAGETVKSFFDDVKKDFADIGREVAAQVKADVKSGLQSAWGELKGALVDILRTGADALLKAALGSKEDPAPVKKDVEVKAKDVEAKRVFYVDSKGVATTSLPPIAKPVEKPVVEKPVVEKPVVEKKPSFEPGKVSFGGAKEQTKVALPNIDAPPKGEKKASESLVALRWAAEAAGISWEGKGTGELKTQLSSTKGGLHTKNGASPFEVKARLMERLGLPTGKDRANVHTLDLAVVREEMARRTSLGLDRLAPKADLDKSLAALGLEPTSSARTIAMTSLVKSTQDMAAAKDALKGDVDNASKRAAFDASAKSLDAAKSAMLDTIRTAGGDKHVLALDSVDAVEVAHGKMGATTKLGFAVESLTQGKVGATLQKALNLDDAGFAKARDAALRASEWTTLGEMTTTSSVLAFPGPPDGAGRALITQLPAQSAQLAKELGLVDGDAHRALADHLTYTGKESGGAQLLGIARMLSSLATRRDFRTKEQLSQDDIHNELMKNARPPDPKVDARLVSLLQPVLGEALAALRS
jgi:hypothetical protein